MLETDFCPSFADPVSRPRETDWKDVGASLIHFLRCILSFKNKCRLVWTVRASLGKFQT